MPVRHNLTPSTPNCETIMGLLSKLKGWLNIGGVKLLLWKYTDPLSKTVPSMTGGVLFKSKSAKTVLSLEVKVIEEFTTTEGSGEDKSKKTETTVLGSIKFPGYDIGVGYPLDLKAGEDKEQTFTFPLTLTSRLQNMGGVLGGVGKALSFLSGDKLEYFIVAEASVKGAAFKTSAKHKLKIGD